MDNHRRAVVENAMRRALAVTDGTSVDMYFATCRYMPKDVPVLTYKESMSVLKALRKMGHVRFTYEFYDGMEVKKMRIGIYSLTISDGV